MAYLTINNKSVFIVDDHDEVLEAWADTRMKVKTAPHLVTFDSHTDTYPAFVHHLKQPLNYSIAAAASESLVRAIDYRHPATVQGAMAKLEHDEHIDCAIRAGIIDRAFVFLGVTDGEYDHNPLVEVFKTSCVSSDPLHKIHDEKCRRELADNVLDDRFIAPNLARTDAALGCLLLEQDYILDIDLDVFRTTNALHPADATSFHSLIHNALLITIARETQCVLDLRLAGETLTAADAEVLLIGHIQSS